MYNPLRGALLCIYRVQRLMDKQFNGQLLIDQSVSKLNFF